MPKLELNDVTNLNNTVTAIPILASNNQKIEDALENTLSRNGTSPNQMNAPLDMNSNRIINLPVATSLSEPITGNDLVPILNAINALATAGVSLDSLVFSSVNVLNNFITPQMVQTLIGFNETYVTIEQFAGANAALVGTSNGTTGNGPDESGWFNAALTYANTYGKVILVSPGIHRLASSVISSESGSIQGATTPMYYPGVDSVPTALSTRGSWLYFDHVYTGLQFGTNHIIGGTKIAQLGFIRNQPTPGSSAWIPTDATWDIVTSNSDTFIFDTLHLRSCRGVLSNFGGYGRLEIDRMRGQFFNVGIHLEDQFDLPKIRNCHFWPFWSQDQYVTNYCLNALEAIQFNGVDGVQLDNFFCISANKGINFQEKSGHSDRAMSITNLYTDVGATGIWVDTTVLDGVTLDVVNWLHNAFVTTPGANPPTSVGRSGWALDVRGNYSEISVKNLRSEWSPEGIVRILGTGNIVQADVSEMYKWNRNTLGSSAFYCNTNNILTVLNLLKIDGDSLAAANVFDGGGVILYPLSKTINAVTFPPSGTTSITVAHNQLRTPSPIQVRSFFAGNPYSSTKTWISNITSTTMLINIDVAPGTSVLVGWEANAFS